MSSMRSAPARCIKHRLRVVPVDCPTERFGPAAATTLMFVPARVLCSCPNRRWIYLHDTRVVTPKDMSWMRNDLAARSTPTAFHVSLELPHDRCTEDVRSRDI